MFLRDDYSMKQPRCIVIDSTDFGESIRLSSAYLAATPSVDRRAGRRDGSRPLGRYHGEAEGIGGAYAFYRPGQWFTVRPILSRPHGRVSFAGEHLSEPWQGFMEGAVETGQTAAARLIKYGF